MISSAAARLDQHDSKADVDLVPFLTLRPVDQICHLWQRYTTTALLPLASASAGMRREMGTFNAHGLVRLEGKVNNVIQKTIDGEYQSPPYGSDQGVPEDEADISSNYHLLPSASDTAEEDGLQTAK